MADRGVEDPTEHVRELLDGGDTRELRAFLIQFHPSDLADLIEELEEDERRGVFLALADEPALAAEALAEMEWEEHPEESLASLAPHQIASLVTELSDDDAADIIGELEPDDRDRVLAALTKTDAGDIRELLRYDEESAGGIMTTELVAVDERMSATEAIEAVRVTHPHREVELAGRVEVIDLVEALRHLEIALLPLGSWTARCGAHREGAEQLEGLA